VLFFSAFALVIAIVKDVADTKGDEAHALGSLAIAVGRRATLDIAGGILQLTLAFGILVAANRKQLPIVLAAVYVSTRLSLKSKYTDINDNDQVSRL
jgi:4-hydroxybenzoate polyprenyltransferase